MMLRAHGICVPLGLCAILGPMSACQVRPIESGWTGHRDDASGVSSSGNWSAYLGDAANTHFSALDQIHKGNVARLRVAWIHHTGDATANSRMPTNPLIVDGILFGVSPGLKAFALDATTGERIWTFEPPADSLQGQAVSRGFAYWRRGADQRVFYGAGSKLYALDPATGGVIRSFGRDGAVDLRQGLDREVAGQRVVVRSPGVVYEDLLIQGTTVSESRDAAPGHIRAYDVRTGEQKWIFHTIPHPGEPGHETWPADAWRTAGGANAWAGLALDATRGIVYVPTGAPSIQYFGGEIAGDNLFSSTLVALDARTGRRIWHFQIHHHDIFDRDLPAPPNLVTLTRGGRRIHAVAQVTKTGFVFVFDRVTGEPLFPIEERPVAASPLQGETASPTQPFPIAPAPFARQSFTEADVTDLSPRAHAEALERFRRIRSGGPFNPPSVEGTLFFPMINGGAEWGGAAIDPRAGILYVNANDLPQILTMSEPVETPPASGWTGPELYATYCSGCHGSDREGSAGPPLRNLADRMDGETLLRLIDAPLGFMPSFAQTLTPAEKEVLTSYVLDLAAPPVATAPADTAAIGRRGEARYRVASNERFVDHEGYPAVKPPWGTFSAIDLNTGETLWRVPLGEYPELSARGIPPTGTENYGGPVVTAGGLIFIGATKDEMLRALDSATGEVLWKAKLPFGGYATPAVYAVNGRQYVVIAAGGGAGAGGWSPTPSGDAYVAFALPD